MRPGYKQTEIGVIPEDWNAVPFSELKPYVTSGSRGWASFYSKQGSLFVRITNLSRQSIYLDLSDSKFVALPAVTSEGIRTRLIEHDILISITADIGMVGYVDATIPSPAYINQHIALVRFDPVQTCGKFVSYFLSSENSQKLFRATTDTGAKAGMSLATLLDIQTALPPLREQRAIAAALSDVDALLGGIGRLIAKKRDIKQAAMQQLLTGQTRLPGFHGEWEIKSFDKVLSRLNAKANQIKTVDYKSTGTYPVVDQGKLTVIGFSDRADKRFHCPEGGVIVFGDHTCFVKFIDFDFLVGADGTQIIRGQMGQSTLFHAFQLQYQGVDSTGYNRHFKFLKTRRFRVAVLAEQTAIAAVLSDMDTELSTLESRRDKTRALKQSMMQELLTGRTRLV